MKRRRADKDDEGVPGPGAVRSLRDSLYHQLIPDEWKAVFDKYFLSCGFPAIAIADSEFKIIGRQSLRNGRDEWVMLNFTHVFAGDEEKFYLAEREYLRAIETRPKFLREDNEQEVNFRELKEFCACITVEAGLSRGAGGVSPLEVILGGLDRAMTHAWQMEENPVTSAINAAFAGLAAKGVNVERGRDVFIYKIPAALAGTEYGYGEMRILANSLEMPEEMNYRGIDEGKITFSCSAGKYGIYQNIAAITAFFEKFAGAVAAFKKQKVKLARLQSLHEGFSAIYNAPAFVLNYSSRSLVSWEGLPHEIIEQIFKEAINTYGKNLSLQHDGGYNWKISGSYEELAQFGKAMQEDKFSIPGRINLIDKIADALTGCGLKAQKLKDGKVKISIEADRVVAGIIIARYEAAITRAVQPENGEMEVKTDGIILSVFAAERLASNFAGFKAAATEGMAPIKPRHRARQNMAEHVLGTRQNLWLAV